MVSRKSFQIRGPAKSPNHDRAPIRARLRRPPDLLPARRLCRPGETTAPGPDVTARVGGIPGGVVTLTPATPPRVVAAASWGGRTISVTRTSEREALAVANAWIDQLAAGHEPTP